MSDLRKAAADAIRIMEQHQGTWRHTSFDFVIADLKAALAEPEQSEPVGYLNKHTGQFFSDVEGYKGSLLQPLFAAPPRREYVPSDGWLQEGSLLYRLTDESKPQNRDEINVTMADGSRSEASRTRRAGELLDRIRETRREPLTDEHLQEGVRAWFDNDIVPGQYPFSRRMRAAIEAAHGIKP